MILLWIVIGLVLILCVALACLFIGAGMAEENDSEIGDMLEAGLSENDNEVEEMLNGKKYPE